LSISVRESAINPLIAQPQHQHQQGVKHFTAAAAITTITTGQSAAADGLFTRIYHEGTLAPPGEYD